jgi:hypothetical protein
MTLGMFILLFFIITEMVLFVAITTYIVWMIVKDIRESD